MEFQGTIIFVILIPVAPVIPRRDEEVLRFCLTWNLRQINRR